MIGREIDRKLRLTAAVLGASTRKDLAAAFRRVNPNTAFDIERANKWLQGRARPRELSVYEDWANLLDLGRSGRWIAECDVNAFIDAVSARHDRDREELERATSRRAASAGNGAQTEVDVGLTGFFVSYSHAWSRHFRGQLIRGELSIEVEPGASRLIATYVQNLPTGIAQLNGSVALSQRTLNLDLSHAASGERYSMCLFRPMAPASVLVGYFSGITYLSAEAELTTARIALIRLPAGCRLGSGSAYLPADMSMAADLAANGLPMRDPGEVDRRLAAFLRVGSNRGIDQIAADEYLALTELFDQNWLTQVALASASRG